MRAVMAIVGVLALAAPASGVELGNDSFASGAQVFYQGGFVAGEIGAARLTPATGATVQLRAVRFLFGGATTTQTITVHVWDDPAGGTGNAPGAELYHGDFDVTGQDDARQELDLSAQGIVVSGPFRVGIEVSHRGFPGLATDGDGTITADANFLFTGGAWHRSSEAAIGLRGDWIIRADVVPLGSIVDAGPDAAPDATVRRDAGRDGAAATCDGGACKPSDDGGCGCRTAGQPGRAPWAALGLVALLGAALRRRARRFTGAGNQGPHL